MCSRPPPSPSTSTVPSPATAPSCHPLLVPLRALFGVWVGDGNGCYPTIAPFQYGEEIEFKPLGMKPVLEYSQRTWSLPDPQMPLHAEKGYLRVLPSAATGGETAALAPHQLELTVCDPTGLAHAYAGMWDTTSSPTQSVLTLETVAIASTPLAKPVQSVRRVLTFNNSTRTMSYTLDMAAVGQEQQLHLSAALAQCPSASEIREAAQAAASGAVPKYVLIDVREAHEVEAAPQVGFLNIPMGQAFRPRDGGPEASVLCAAPATAIILCASGFRARIVAAHLRASTKNGHIFSVNSRLES